MCFPGPSAWAGELLPIIRPEQRQVEARPAEEIEYEPLLANSSPRTVARVVEEQPILLSLDEAIRICLANADVIRILAGNTAVSSGRTIYDPAIANTGIDVEQSRFDPTLGMTNRWSRFENGVAFYDPLNPNHALIAGTGTDNYDFRTSLQQTNTTGGTGTFSIATSPTTFRNQLVPLNRQGGPAAELSYTQPLLQGAGFQANLAPIVIARIGTERSFYQFKDIVQEQVRSVVDGYWSLVVARVDLWVRRQQVEQLEEALRVGEARFRGNINDIAQVAQARSALANFRATQVSAEANVIQREAALRNLIGLPPSDGTELIPVTEPRRDRYLADWNALCDLAAEYRPDLIDLQLALQADGQQLTQAKNNAQPRVDAFALYRWKGLNGVQPDGSFLSTSPGEFNDWNLGINLSVPLGLRQNRAFQRQSELAIARDRANLNQGRHAAVHQLATTTRLVDQTYEQFIAYSEARKAARVSLQYQMALFQNGRTIYLNVLQAITDWGNTISSEANSLTVYNTQLATLERQSGTILETHGVYFYEEQFASTGPFSRAFRDRCYPLALRPDYSNTRYPTSDQPADNSFELSRPGSAVGRDPLPELPYGDLPGVDSSQPLDSREGGDIDLPPVELPELPELPGRGELPPVPGSASRRSPKSGKNQGLEENPFAAAARPQNSTSRLRIPAGNNRLQSSESRPASSRDSAVRPVGHEVLAPSRPGVEGRDAEGFQPGRKREARTGSTPDATVAPAKGPVRRDTGEIKQPSFLKKLFGG